MFKMTYYTVVLFVSFVFAMMIPNYVSTYQSVLSGQIIELERDHEIFQKYAQERNLTLAEYFDNAIKETELLGKKSISYEIVQYSREKIDRYLLHYNHLKILKQEQPFFSLKAVLFSGREFEQTEKIALENFKFGLNLKHSNQWWAAILFVTTCLYAIIVFMVYNLKYIFSFRKIIKT